MKVSGCLSGGALLRGRQRAGADDKAAGLRVLWLTPMRALATDTARARQAPLAALMPGFALGQRTGDTPSSERARQDRLDRLLAASEAALAGDLAGKVHTSRGRKKRAQPGTGAVPADTGGHE